MFVDEKALAWGRKEARRRRTEFQALFAGKTTREAVYSSQDRRLKRAKMSPIAAMTAIIWAQESLLEAEKQALLDDLKRFKTRS